MAWVGGSYISIGTKEAIMVSWWWVVVSGVVCGFGGLLLACMCSASKRADEEMEAFERRFNNERGGTF